MWLSLLKLLIALPVVLGCLMALLKGAQRFGQIQPINKNLQIIEQLRVSPKSSVMVLKVGNDHLLIGVSEEQITLLKDLTSDTDIEWLTQPPHSDVQTIRSFNRIFLKEGWNKK